MCAFTLSILHGINSDLCWTNIDSTRLVYGLSTPGYLLGHHVFSNVTKYVCYKHLVLGRICLPRGEEFNHFRVFSGSPTREIKSTIGSVYRTASLTQNNLL